MNGTHVHLTLTCASNAFSLLNMTQVWHTRRLHTMTTGAVTAAFVSVLRSVMTEVNNLSVSKSVLK